MKINIVHKIFGTGFFTGYLPGATGTYASMLAFLIYLIPGFENVTIMLLLISVFTVTGLQLGDSFEKSYGKDPKEFTLDEIVGSWISLLLVPKIYVYVIPAFIIWRFMDIIKPFPAKTVEKLKGGKGIMFDDIISGFYSLILIHIIVYLTY